MNYRLFTVMIVLLHATQLYGMKEEEIEFSKKPYDYVVDLSTVIFPDHTKSEAIIKENAGINSSISDLVSLGWSAVWSYCKTIVTDEKSLKEEMTCKLNAFLRNTPLPENWPSSSTTVFIEDRSNKEYNKGSLLMSAFMCAKDHNEEEFLRKYVLDQFKTTKNTHITELSESLKKVFCYTIEFMFNTAYVNKIMGIDETALDMLIKLSKKSTVALVHNMPQHVDIKNIEHEQTKKLYDLTQSNDFYTSGAIGTVTTDSLFYTNVPINEETIFITNCNSNQIPLEENSTFANFLIYDYTKPDKLRNKLNL